MRDFIFNAIAIVGLVFVSFLFAAQMLDERALAYNCYFEARNSTLEDQIATMVVVMNRGKPRIEVFKKGQFSWTTEYSKPADNDSLKKCQAVAHMVYNNHKLFQSKDICKHYTTVGKEYGDGHWTKTFKRRTQIGKHWYYCS